MEIQPITVENLKQIYSRKNIICKTNEKGYRHKKITKKQQRENRKKSTIRARVEHIFGFMSNSMNRMYLRYRSLHRNEVGIGLMNLTYNLFRLVQLNVEVRK